MLYAKCLASFRFSSIRSSIKNDYYGKNEKDNELFVIHLFSEQSVCHYFFLFLMSLFFLSFSFHPSFYPSLFFTPFIVEARMIVTSTLITLDTNFPTDVQILKNIHQKMDESLSCFFQNLSHNRISFLFLILSSSSIEKVAIKILDRSKLDSKTQTMLNREIGSMEKLHHPNLVQLFEVIENFSKIYLVLEFASGGELYHKISNQGKLNESVAKSLFAQIISAIDHMVSNISIIMKEYY